MAWARRISGIIPHFYPIKFFVKWACSIVVIRRIRIAETRVRFSLGPPKFIYSGICLARGFAPRFGGHFGKIIPRIFEINRQFSRRKAAVRADGFLSPLAKYKMRF